MNKSVQACYFWATMYMVRLFRMVRYCTALNLCVVLSLMLTMLMPVISAASVS